MAQGDTEDSGGWGRQLYYLYEAFILRDFLGYVLPGFTFIVGFSLYLSSLSASPTQVTQATPQAATSAIAQSSAAAQSAPPTPGSSSVVSQPAPQTPSAAQRFRLKVWSEIGVAAQLALIALVGAASYVVGLLLRALGSFLGLVIFSNNFGWLGDPRRYLYWNPETAEKFNQTAKLPNQKVLRRALFVVSRSVELLLWNRDLSIFSSYPSSDTACQTRYGKSHDIRGKASFGRSLERESVHVHITGLLSMSIFALSPIAYLLDWSSVAGTNKWMFVGTLALGFLFLIAHYRHSYHHHWMHWIAHQKR